MAKENHTNEQRQTFETEGVLSIQAAENGGSDATRQVIEDTTLSSDEPATMARSAAQSPALRAAGVLGTKLKNLRK